MIEEEDDLDDLDDEFKLESDEEDEVMGLGEDDVEEHSEEEEVEAKDEVRREEDKEEKVNEEARRINKLVRNSHVHLVDALEDSTINENQYYAAKGRLNLPHIVNRPN